MVDETTRPSSASSQTLTRVAADETAADQSFGRTGAAARQGTPMRIGDAGVAIALAAHARDCTAFGL